MAVGMVKTEKQGVKKRGYSFVFTLIGIILLLLWEKFRRGYGSTRRERNDTLPGDGLVSNPDGSTTHALTIDASPAEIWPWLVQMGYHRGGWYIDSLWDAWLNLSFWPRVVPPEAQPVYWPSAIEILPQWQGLSVGDRVPDGPEGTAYFTVTHLVPESELVLFSTSHLRYLLPGTLHNTPLATHGDFSWAFILLPQSGGQTRLILRMRATLQPQIIRWLAFPLLVVVDYFYSREILWGINRRVVAEKLY